MYYYWNYFFFYAIIGHLFESILYLFMDGKSGFLYGFWTPVYGIGCVVLLLVDHYLKKKKLTNGKRYFYIFLTGFILLTFLEFTGGNLLERLFHKEMWNYEGFRFHFGKYVCMEIAFVWALASVLFIRFLKPFTDRFVLKIPKWVTWILILLFIIDIGCTFFFQLRI